MQEIAKIFALILGIVVIARSLADYRAKKESFQMTVFWVTIWLFVLAMATFPAISGGIIHLFGDNRSGLGTIFGMAIVFVLFICYRIYIKAQRIEKQINAITRNIALRDMKGKRK